MSYLQVVEETKTRGNLKILDESPPPNKWRDAVMIASVGPQGQFSVTPFDRYLLDKGEDIKMGLTPVTYNKDADRQFTIARGFPGYVLYEDLCMGRVPNVEASPEHWKLWQAIVKMYARGHAPARGALERAAAKIGLKSIFHPEVERRRKLVADGGFFALDVDEIMKLYGIEGAEESDEIVIEAEG